MLTLKTFSYATPDQHPLQRTFIRTIERFTGQLKLWRIYLEYQKEYGRTQESFWDAAVRKLELGVQYDRETLAKIPKTGPLVVVANHPYGVLDGIIINQLMQRVRGDYKVLTNSVLTNAPEASDSLLPIDFDFTKEALQTNLDTRAKARALLKNGGAIAVFPAGGVSTIPTWRDKVAQDMQWQSFIGRLIHESNATVVPVFFEGQNSRLFQLASCISATLRTSLFFKELSDRMGSYVGLRIGAPIPYKELAKFPDRRVLCEELRRRTYSLGGMDDLPPAREAYRIDPKAHKKDSKQGKV